MTLFEKLIEIAKNNVEGMSREEAIYWLDNDAIPSIGGVAGLIYYNETEPLSREYYEEIIELMQDAEVHDLSLNDMAWFAWDALIFGRGEEIVTRILD